MKSALKVTVYEHPTLDLPISDQGWLQNPTRVGCNIQSFVANHIVPQLRWELCQH